MDKILEQIARARRRLAFELLLNRILRCWFVAMLLVLVAVAVPRLMVIKDLPAGWDGLCLLTGLIGGFVAAIAWTLWRGSTTLEAAQEIDHRFGLRERVASSVSLSPEDADSPAGRALVSDTERAVRRIDVDDRFRLRLDRRAWWPAAPAMMAFALILFVENRQAQSSTEPNADPLTKQQLDNSTKQLRDRLLKKKKQAAERGLKDAEQLFLKLEKQTKDLGDTKDADRKKALVKLNDLANQLEKRQAKLGGQEALRKQLSCMKDLGKGPAEKMFKAMQNGQWQEAMNQMQKLQKQIQAGELTPEAKQQLQKQLDKLQEKLAEAARQQQQAIDQLKEQIEKARQQGDLSKASELQQQLDKLQEQQKANPLQQLSEQMSQCQQCMKSGDAAGASKAMSQMMQMMDQMQDQLAESDMLDGAMEQLEMARDSMSCSNCQGMGCEMCQGGYSFKPGQKPGNGMGQGRGFGPRPDEPNDVGFRDSRVRQKPGRGAAVLAGEADGPNMRGQVAQSIKEELAAEKSTDADPLVIDELPKSRREHAEEYFNLLREGD